MFKLAVLAATISVAVAISVVPVPRPGDDKTFKIGWGAEGAVAFNETVPSSSMSNLGDWGWIDWSEAFSGEVAPDDACMVLDTVEAVVPNDGMQLGIEGYTCNEHGCEFVRARYELHKHVGYWKIYLPHVGTMDPKKDTHLKMKRSWVGLFSSAGHHMIATARLEHASRDECHGSGPNQ